MKEIKEYYSNLNGLIDKNNFFEKANLLPYCKDMAHSAFIEANFIYENDGIARYRSETNKASIAHKILFDFSKKSAHIYAKGFHTSILDKKYVIDALSGFVLRALDNGNETPVILVSKDTRNRLDNNMRESKFFEELESLKNKTGSPVYSIKHIAPDVVLEKSLREEIRISENEGVKISVALEKVERKANRISSFSIFDGKFFRYRDDGVVENKAYINFGDEKTSDVLENFFQSIGKKATEIT